MLNKYLLQYLVCVLFIFINYGCRKDKLEPVDASYTASLVNTSSSIRLFNFTNTDVDITINNIPLTNYSSGTATKFGLSLFPTGVWANSDGGSPFYIPAYLLDKNQKAHVVIAPRSISYANTSGTNNFVFPVIDTVLLNNPSTPMDYYVLFNGFSTISRNTAAPSSPSNFKIRIINLMNDPDNIGYYGPVTLTYADGTHVDDSKTSNVAPNTVSDYTELPLGAYQFKLFLNGDYGKQIIEFPLKPNCKTSDTGNTASQQKVQSYFFPKIRTFKAGSVYSIVISKSVVQQPYAGSTGDYFPWMERVNGYRIVTEQSAATNVTYACMDAVNAVYGTNLNILVDGVALGSNLSFGQSASHKVYVYGTHHVTAVDQSGNTVAEKDVYISANDYLTAWAYTDSTGKGNFAFSNTDFSSGLYLSNSNGTVNITTNNASTTGQYNDDGTDGSMRVASYSNNYVWQSRFLNLSEDIPYVTFGQNYTGSITTNLRLEELLLPAPTSMGGTSYYDSASYPAATCHLTRGNTAVTDPNLIYKLSNSVSSTSVGLYGGAVLSSEYVWIYPTGSTSAAISSDYITTFQSNPGPPEILPGLALNVNLKWTGFVASSSIYSSYSSQPFMETGYYSVALIGNVSAGTAKLIYVKHNQ